MESKTQSRSSLDLTSLSSEALEEAASQGAEEAVAEAQGSMAQSGTKVASMIGEQLGLQNA